MYRESYFLSLEKNLDICGKSMIALQQREEASSPWESSTQDTTCERDYSLKRSLEEKLYRFNTEATC